MSYPKHRKSSVYPDDQKRNSYGLPIVVCSKCHLEKRVARRTKKGLPLCPSCYKAQKPKRRCGQCGKMHTRETTKDGKFLCGTCYFRNRPKVPCMACGNLHSKNNTNPICMGCFKMLRNGFTLEQIQKISQQRHCDYPNCLIKRHKRKLCADHLHNAPCQSSHKYSEYACPQCLRGVICYGHNRLLADLDLFPDEVNEEAKTYLGRIGYLLDNTEKTWYNVNSQMEENNAKSTKKA